jgi:hypothetical protein
MSFTPEMAAMNVLSQGHYAFPWCSQWVDSVQVTGSGNVQTYNVAALRTALGLPAQAAFFLIFGSDQPFYFNPYAAAALPSGNTTNGEASTYSPNQRYIDKSITSLSFTAAQLTNISLQFYRP